MAEHLGVGAAAEGDSRAEVPAAPQLRLLAGERLISRTLKGGAALSGGLFLGSLVLELLPVSLASSVMIDHLRKAAASVLLVTPVVRLGVAGVSLGCQGEYRYLLYAAGVLALLGFAVSQGISA